MEKKILEDVVIPAGEELLKLGLERLEEMLNDFVTKHNSVMGIALRDDLDEILQKFWQIRLSTNTRR